MNGKYIAVLSSCNYELAKIKDWIDNNKLDSNVKYLVSYAIIKSCGTIELLFKTIVFDFLSKNANEEAINYLMKNILDSSCNPSPGQIQRMLEQINSEWAKSFDEKIKRSSQKGQLKSLVQLRNSFAHGNEITASIEDVNEYYDSGKWILLQLYDVINTV